MSHAARIAGFVMLVTLLSLPKIILAQKHPGSPIVPAPADPAISGALKGISPDRIRTTIETLVGFNNRSTLSSMETDLAPTPVPLPPPTGSPPSSAASPPSATNAWK